jgi:AcrR family transcriptional regulator
VSSEQRPVGLRERKKRRTREEILEAALELFRERGYDATRVQDIIERVGISEGTFFNYFPTKDALLHDFALVQVDLYRGALRHELAADERSVAERIRELMQAAALALAQDPDFQAVVYTRSDLFQATGVLEAKARLMYDQLAALFRVGQKRGEIRRDVEPIQLAEIMTGIYHLTVVNWLTRWWGDRDEQLAPRLGRAIDVFLDGCRPRLTE